MGILSNILGYASSALLFYISYQGYKVYKEFKENENNKED